MDVQESIITIMMVLFSGILIFAVVKKLVKLALFIALLVMVVSMFTTM